MERNKTSNGTCSRRHVMGPNPKPNQRLKKSAGNGSRSPAVNGVTGRQGTTTKPRGREEACRAMTAPGDYNGSVGGGSANGDSTFPACSVWFLWAGTLVVRLYLITRPDSGWILHPDEVFQSVEVSHSLVYGYGFRPYEYLPPPNPNSSLVVERQEAATGMYSLRSFLYPHVLGLVLWLAETLGLATNPFQTCRMFHAIVAAHLPVSVYLLTRSWLAVAGTPPSERRDVAVLAAVLVALSTQLTVLGTHPLINSCLAPVTFLSLALFLRILVRAENSGRKRSETSSECVDSQQHSDDSGISSDNESHGEHGFERQQNGSQNNDQHSTVSKQCIINSTWCNNNFVNKHNTWSVHFCCRFVSILSKSLKTDSDKWLNGVIFGLLVYIRPDQVLLISTVCLSAISLVFTVKGTSTTVRILLHISFGAVTGITIGGYQDYRTYGAWFLSPHQWFTFNVRRGMSSALFGSQDLCFYVNELFLRNKHMTISMVLVVVTFLFCMWRRLTSPGGNSDIRSARLLPYLMAPFLTLLSIYSLQKHKELRFVHNLVVLFQIMLGVSLYRILHHITQRNLRTLATLSTLLFLALSLQTSIALPARKSNVEWAYLQHWDSNHINDCLGYVGCQADSTGVFLDRSIHISGGYSVLHKNIPIFSLVHYEFQEFGLSSQTPMSGDRAWLSRDPVRVSKLNRVSNFVTAENTPLLLKYLIDQPEYNYLVVRRQREVISVGFEEVFTSGTMRVLKRTYDGRSEGELRRIADSIPLGSNATVLEYEGSWLHTLGLYRMAVERLLYAARLSEVPRARIYQLLAMCYNGLGQRDRAREVYERCLQTHGDTCSRPQPKVILHSDYDLDIQI